LLGGALHRTASRSRTASAQGAPSDRTGRRSGRPPRPARTGKLPGRAPLARSRGWPAGSRWSQSPVRGRLSAPSAGAS